jgi:hypothetical protein
VAGLLTALDGLTGHRMSKGSIPGADDPNVSQGPFEFVGADPDESQRLVWEVVKTSSATLTQGGRAVGRVMEVCQWPYPQGDLPARTMFACIHWTDPSAAGSDDLALAGRPVRLLGG